MALSTISGTTGITDATITSAKLADFSAAVDLNGVELLLDADQDTSISADTDDTIDIKIGGADDFQFTANTFTALSGSTIKANTIAETTSTSGVTIDGVLLKDGVLGANTVDSDAYVDGSIDNAHLADDAVDSDEIAAGAIDLAHMSVNSIDSDQYVDGSIDTAHIANDQITAALMADNSIDSDMYVDGSIDLAHMSSESVDEDNLYISNAGSNGQYLSKQSGNSGGLTWATVDTSTLLPLGGGTMTGDLILGDNVMVEIGSASGGDLRLYHDGSHSYVNNQGTGDLLIRGDDVKIQDAASGHNMATFTEDGAVELYHNNIKMLETHSNGISLGQYELTSSGGHGGNYVPLNFDNTASDMYTPFYKANCDRTSNSHSFAFLAGYQNNYGDLEIHIRGDGQAYADQSWSGGGADYAEYFEWEDGNPSDEDRRGHSVVLSGNKVELAEEGDAPFGVVSATPVVVGDDDIDRWKQKYLRDDFGQVVMEDGAWIQWTDADGTKHSHESNAIPEGVTPPGDAVTVTVDETGADLKRRKLNPAWVEGQEYVARENRKEWVTIGLVGKLRIKKGQPTDARWIKMRDVSDAVEEWLIR